MRTELISILVILLAACDAGSDRSSTYADEADASANDASEADANYTMAGVYRCCLPGIGKACCEGVKQGMCFEYGGGYRDCRKQGEVYEGKVICAHCCEGLERLENDVPGDAVPPELDGLPDGCDHGGPPSILLCGKCGDGVCGAGESFCNCAADCPRPTREGAGRDGG